MLGTFASVERRLPCHVRGAELKSALHSRSCNVAERLYVMEPRTTISASLWQKRCEAPPFLPFISDAVVHKSGKTLLRWVDVPVEYECWPPWISCLLGGETAMMLRVSDGAICPLFLSDIARSPSAVRSISQLHNRADCSSLITRLFRWEIELK